MTTNTNNQLRFGVFMQPLHHPSENPTLALERDLQLLQHLDQLGFDEAWIGEHHSTGWETISSPEVFMAIAAERTRNIKLGTGVVPLSMQHPMHVIDRSILLDHLTRGRIMLGVGVGGGLPSDLHVFGVDADQAYPRFQESFQLIMDLLETTEPISRKTDWFEVRDAILQLRPYSKSLPIAIASGSPTSLEMVGQYGTQLLTMTDPTRVPDLFEHIQHGANSVGRIASRDQITLAFSMHLAPTRQQALDDIRQGIATEKFDFGVGVNGHPMPEVHPDDWVEHVAETQLIGTADDAIEKIHDILTISGGFGGMLFRVKEWAPRQAQWDSFELFARYVMPHFNGSLVGLHMAERVAKEFNQKRVAVS